MADMCNTNVCILWHFLGKLTYLLDSRPHYFHSSRRSLMITNSNLCIRRRQGINFCQASKSFSIPLSSFEAAWFSRRRSVFGPQMSWWSGHYPQRLCNIAHTNHWAMFYIKTFILLNSVARSKLFKITDIGDFLSKNGNLSPLPLFYCIFMW